MDCQPKNTMFMGEGLADLEWFIFFKTDIVTSQLKLRQNNASLYLVNERLRNSSFKIFPWIRIPLEISRPPKFYHT